MSTLRYAITDRTLYGETEPARRAGLIQQASRLAAQGIDILQLREKDLDPQDLVPLARGILDAIRSTGTGSRTRLLINSRADVAIAAGADGVHLPGGDQQLTIPQLRQILKTTHATLPTISVSCHTLEEVQRAAEAGADVILFGPVFGKSIHGQTVVPGAGLEALTAACRVANGTPVLALGGVTRDNTAACLAAGARGIAAIRLFR